MDNKDSNNDLILDLSPNMEKLLEEGLVTTDIIALRDTVNDLNPNTLDKYSDSLLYRAYYAAKKRHTNSSNVLARELKISTKLFNYYIDTYPKFGLVIQMGLMDATEEMKNDIVDSLYKASKGQTVKEKAVITETEYDDEGVVLGSKQKISEAEKYIPPNTQAAIELLRKLDPSWNPKLDINVTENKLLHVVEDVNVAVDYRKLSTDALRELLQSQQSLGSTTDLRKLENGNPIRSLSTYVPPTEEEMTEEQKIRKQHQHSSTPARKRAKRAVEIHDMHIQKAKKQAKKQALLNLKENKK